MLHHIPCEGELRAGTGRPPALQLLHGDAKKHGSGTPLLGLNRVIDICTYHATRNIVNEETKKLKNKKERNEAEICKETAVQDIRPNYVEENLTETGW